MAQRRRELENRCLRKRMHRTRTEAEMACRDRPQLKPYRCPDCGLWHVGHRKRPRRSR